MLGFVGVFVPLLPTTPFILLAAFCFSRSSASWHQYLLNNKTFGRMIRDWESGGVIGLRAKLMASLLMTTIVGYSIIFAGLSSPLKCLILAVIVAVLAFIWSRPSEPGPGENS